MGTLPTIDQIVYQKRFNEPFYCFRPETIIQNGRFFGQRFPGTVMYAVKCNPHAAVIEALYRSGVRNFEAASLAEIKRIRDQLGPVELHFMHPIKPREAIRIGYHQYGVRNFAFDDLDELTKIVEATDRGNDLGLFLRIAVSSRGAILDLSKRFGVSPERAPSLLRQARPYSARLGVCFHVGSQCLQPEAFKEALETMAAVIEQTEEHIDILDIGGGFPVKYPSMSPPPLESFVDVIKAYTQPKMRLWCEPGRALVADAGSLIVQVLARRNAVLFINDGVFGGLADAGVPHYFRYPARLIPATKPSTAITDLEPFSLSGPTCDGHDWMPGPFWLPRTVAEGDWIELGQLGAYSISMRSQFHGFQGFDHVPSVLVRDPPLLRTLSTTSPCLTTSF